MFAQNVTKADLANLESQLNALSQKVSQLEMNLERVITENFNLVDQLNLKTVTSLTDENGVQWDIVKVEPNKTNSEVVISLRVTNKTGLTQKVELGINIGTAIDSNSNMSNNGYNVVSADNNLDISQLADGTIVNIQAVIKDVPTTCAYLASVNLFYMSGFKKKNVVFNGVHVPW